VTRLIENQPYPPAFARSRRNIGKHEEKMRSDDEQRPQRHKRIAAASRIFTFRSVARSVNSLAFFRRDSREIVMAEIDCAFQMPEPQFIGRDEIDFPGRRRRRDRTIERCEADGAYPTPAGILSRIGALFLIFLWIAAAADCLVDALGM
jgi:hypothetical protein